MHDNAGEDDTHGGFVSARRLRRLDLQGAELPQWPPEHQRPPPQGHWNGGPRTTRIDRNHDRGHGRPRDAPPPPFPPPPPAPPRNNAPPIPRMILPARPDRPPTRPARPTRTPITNEASPTTNTNNPSQP